MSFFKSFLGAAFAQSARDSKKRQEELDAWNKLFDEATDMSSEFSNYLTRLGITDSYVSPPIEDNLELIRSGKSGLNELYFEKQQKLIQEISEWYACEPVQTKIFFRIENIDIVKSFFEYAYYNGETQDDLIEFCSYTVEDGKMVVDNYATVDLDNALRGYIPFSQTDLQ